MYCKLARVGNEASVNSPNLRPWELMPLPVTLITPQFHWQVRSRLTAIVLRRTKMS